MPSSSQVACNVIDQVPKECHVFAIVSVSMSICSALFLQILVLVRLPVSSQLAVFAVSQMPKSFQSCPIARIVLALPANLQIEQICVSTPAVSQVAKVVIVQTKE